MAVIGVFPDDLGAVTKTLPAEIEGVAELTTHLIIIASRGYTGDGGEPMTAVVFDNLGPQVSEPFPYAFAVIANDNSDATFIASMLASVADLLGEGLAAAWLGPRGANVYPPVAAGGPCVPWPFSTDLVDDSAERRLRGSFAAMQIIPQAQQPTTTRGLPAYFT